MCLSNIYSVLDKWREVVFESFHGDQELKLCYRLIHTFTFKCTFNSRYDLIFTRVTWLSKVFVLS